MTASTAIQFTHPNSHVGNLTVENGLDQAQWAYQLNTQVYPTYGGEVVQILSVYVDDLTLGGSIATYAQAELIYSYFARYFAVATAGTSATPNVNNGSAYNLEPMIFTYPMRGWTFSIYPKTAPGFSYDVEMVNPTWLMTAHIDDSINDLTSIKTTIQQEAATFMQQKGVTSTDNSFGRLTDQISPQSGDPNTDPFQTFNEGDQAASQALGGLSDYYASLVNGYTNGNFAGITGGVGSKPSSPSKTKTATTTTKTSDKIAKSVANTANNIGQGAANIANKVQSGI